MNTEDSPKVVGGRYRIMRALGKGSYGETYLAEDIHLPANPVCVVKRFSPKSSRKDNIELGLRLFKNEAETLYRLGHHEQIPCLLAYFHDEEDWEFYLVQEFVDGKDLTEEIQDKLGEAEVVQLLIDILEVLKYIHQQNVIHRDLKPSNIRRRNDNKIFLIDFGAVKEVSVIDEGQISSTVAIGTEGYIPSEQANRKPRFCSDIYAVGMIAIQSLTGISPRNLGEDPSTGEVNWQNHVTVSKGLQLILTKMVRYYFLNRYQSVEEVLRDLSQLQNRSYVDIVAETKKALELLEDDVRIISGGIVLPEVRHFLVETIDNFENLYMDYSISLADKRLSTFLSQVCKETLFNVDAVHPAKLILRSNNRTDNSVHSESSYRNILMSGHRKFKLPSSRDIIEVARQISKMSINEQNFSHLLDLVSKNLPDIEQEYISNSLLAFLSADCFETQPRFGAPWKRTWTLRSGFDSEEDLLESLRFRVTYILKEALIEIDQDVDENILRKILP